MENKEIRFIDSKYNELFRIRDGENIEITLDTGEKISRECKYIDDYHTQIGNNVYHICEFAELMERNGNTYRPKDTPSYSLENITQDEFEFMFAPKDQSINRGCICYIRGYFDNSIDENFKATCMIENNENYQKYHTPAFSRECDNIINYFRFQADTPILKSRIKMHNAAYDTKAERFANDKEISGYRITTKENVYYLKCDSRQGQYCLYMYCYNKNDLQKHKDLQFIEKNYREIDRDRFFKTTNGLMEMYYNPDSSEGGQIVELTIDFEDIRETAELYKNPKEFFSYLEGISKGALYDVGTETFRETAEYMLESNPDFEGCTKRTMDAIKKYAGIEPEHIKHKTEKEPER